MNIENAGQNALAREWDERELRFSANLYDGLAGEDEVEFKDRNSRLILAAPHSLNHLRGGELKFADRWTGSLVELLGSDLDLSTIIPIGPIRSKDDWDTRDDAFRRLLDAAINPQAVVLDFHGMSNSHEIDLCIGLGQSPSPRARSIARDLVEILSGYVVSINNPFDAKPGFTVTSYVQARGADCIQLEIAAKLRDPSRNPQPAEQFYAAIRGAMSSLKTMDTDSGR